MAAALLLAKAAEQPGLLDSASPALLFGGGLALLAIAAVLVHVVRHLDEEDDFVGLLLSIAGFITGIAGVIGVYRGLFGQS
jgi:hypothetical protein